MSRSTQYIGLNDYARQYLAGQTVVREVAIFLCPGMFDEPIYGTEYHLAPPEGPNREEILVEVVQDTPWSSGPMIFTHLQAFLIKDNGQKLEMGTYFSWMVDPSLKGQEYDSKTGRYYV